MSKIRKFFTIVLSFIIILVLIVVGSVIYAFKIEPHKVTTKEIDISDSEITKDLKIALFADTHFSKNYTTDDFNKAVSTINNQNPDIVIFLGDLFDEYDSYTGNVNEIISALSSINANIGKYAIFGNHDYGGGAENEYKSIMKSGGFKVLVNDTVNFDSYNASLTGVDDFLIGYGSVSSVSGLTPSKYNIVACHEPDVYDNMSACPIDLMVSGHTHGGQIQIPFFKNRYLSSLGKKYVSGIYNFDNDAKTTLYVNRGLGTTKINARFLCTPEITIINLSS